MTCLNHIVFEFEGKTTEMHHVEIVAFALLVAAHVVAGDEDKLVFYDLTMKLAEIKEKREPSIGDFCCISINKFVLYTDSTAPPGPCTYLEDQCEKIECAMRDKGVLDGYTINEGKSKEYLKQVAVSNPETQNMVDSVLNTCFDGKYEKITVGDCAPMKLNLCYYIVGSAKCPEESRDRSEHCEKTFKVFEAAFEILQKD